MPLYNALDSLVGLSRGANVCFSLLSPCLIFKVCAPVVKFQRPYLQNILKTRPKHEQIYTNMEA